MYTVWIWLGELRSRFFVKIKSLYELLIAESETSGLHTSSGGGGVRKAFTDTMGSETIISW